MIIINSRERSSADAQVLTHSLNYILGTGQGVDTLMLVLLVELAAARARMIIFW